MARAILVIPPENFSCPQLLRARACFQQARLEVQVASSVRTTIQQAHCTVTPDQTLAAVHGGDYDAVVFIAGRGNRQLLTEPDAHRIAREAQAASRVIGASGLAVGILANAGLLAGRRATGPISIAALLKEKGADYTPEPIVVDDRIVTLRRAESFAAFCEQIVSLATGGLARAA